MKKIYLAFLLMIISFKSFAAQETPFRDGEVKLIKLNIPSSIKVAAALKVKAFNLNFPAFAVNETQSYYALISSPLGVISGEYEIKVFDGDKLIGSQKLVVLQRGSIQTEEILDAPEINVLPRNSSLVARVASEDLEQKNTLIQNSPERLWHKSFIKPVTVKINSDFGLYRVYSKHLRRRTHWGVDFHTPIGTAVKASADGVVTVSKEYYFPGKTIVIDHGMGLFTGYSHLSKISVKPGDKIKRGQIIGKTGVSGKVTGPHLHWFAVNGRVKFDPLTLLNIDLTE